MHLLLGELVNQPADIMEWSRKGFKYLSANEPSGLGKCVVGGDSNTISSIAWSPQGIAPQVFCCLAYVAFHHSPTHPSLTTVATW